MLTPAILSLALFVGPAVKPVVLVLDLAVLALVAYFDLVSVARGGPCSDQPGVRFDLLAGRAAAGEALHREPEARGRRLRLRDDVPGSFTAEPAEFRVDVAGPQPG